MTRPVLRRGVRLTYDQTRQTHVLLFPEGVVVPNATAVAVLERCDGEATIADITTGLATRFRGVREQDVVDVLSRLADKRIVEWR